MNQEQARDNMIKQQVRTWEVSDPRVVAALSTSFLAKNLYHNHGGILPIPIRIS